MKKPSIDTLLSSTNPNNGIIELDNYISQLCKWGDALNALTGPQKIFFFNQNIEREVNNGGFRLFFINSAGNFAHQTVESLQAIDALKAAKILQAAINQFPENIVPANRELRSAIVGKMDNEKLTIWNDLDDQFLKYEENLNALNLNFVRQHRESF